MYVTYININKKKLNINQMKYQNILTNFHLKYFLKCREFENGLYHPNTEEEKKGKSFFFFIILF